MASYASRHSNSIVRRAIDASKDRPLWRLLAGLNIRHVGSHVAQVLASAFLTIDALAGASADDALLEEAQLLAAEAMRED